MGGDIEIRVSVTYNKTTSVSSVGGEVLAGEEVAEFELDGEGGGSPDAEFDALSVLGNVERTYVGWFVNDTGLRFCTKSFGWL